MLLIVFAIAIGFYMAFNVGSNDGANSMADAVGSKAITVFWAVILGAIFEFLGAVLVGSPVSDTVRKGIIDTQAFAHHPEFLAYGMLCALLASALWLHLSSLLGMPVSTTHSIVGSIVGFGFVFGGYDQVHWVKIWQIVASWFISPAVGGLVAFFIFKLTSKFILGRENPILAARKGFPVCVFIVFTVVIMATIFKGLKNLHLDLDAMESIQLSVAGGLLAAFFSLFFVKNMKPPSQGMSVSEQLKRVERIFVPLVIITSCSVAFAHGANDVANAIGPLAAIVEIVQTGDIPKKVAVDLWILILGGSGIAAGLIVFGHRVIRTVGEKITDLTPSRGVAADIGASVTVLACSKIGLPISTTHTLVGAVLGVGMARGIAAINIQVVKSIFTSWLATIPFTAALTVFFFAVLRIFFLGGG